ncbi:glycogenin 1 isoform X1 [Xylocopa sonorina]|uniref:glycogenin 1 isoform X1 n=1 Tax=Xylocopa sonorina TaxID=1818115 RepID=UPI00403A9F4B
MGGYAWVTLATNDAYSLGALVLAHSLRRVGTKYELAVLITPGVTQTMREKLSAVFSLVMEVNVLDSKDEANLALLARPELGVTFTKLHCWRLTQYEKCVFLDADTLVIRNCDELFEREELSAAPDVGWPDCFNSGVFVYRPSQQTFASITSFAAAKGSFDGGDQGLLNMYFSDWARKDISKHLPFIYNMCSTATYSYLPAFKQFGDDVRIIHFIGITKPWLQYFDTLTGIVQPPMGSAHLQPLLQLWWNIFCEKVHPQLSPIMATSTLAPIWHKFFPISFNSPVPQSSIYTDIQDKTQNNIYLEPPDFSEFQDPWENYHVQNDPVIHKTENNETQQYYSSINDFSSTSVLSEQFNYTKSVHQTHYESSPEYNREFHYKQQYTESNLPSYSQHNNNQEQYNQFTKETDQCLLLHSNDSYLSNSQSNHYQNQHTAPVYNVQSHHSNESQYQHIDLQYIPQNPCKDSDREMSKETKQHQSTEHQHAHQRFSNDSNKSFSEEIKCNEDIQHQHDKPYVDNCSHHQMYDNVNKEQSTQYYEQENHNSLNIKINHDQVMKDNITHQNDHTIKQNIVQNENVNITDKRTNALISTSPHPNSTPCTEFHNVATQSDPHITDDLNSSNGGLAGALAQMTLGEPRSAEQIALEEHMRKQSWEQGHIDYMGRDSFDNIWKKICETLALAPPRLPSPPKETQKPAKTVTDKTDESVKSSETMQSIEKSDEMDKEIAQATTNYPEKQSLVNNVPKTSVPKLPEKDKDVIDAASSVEKSEDDITAKIATKSEIETLDISIDPSPANLSMETTCKEIAEVSASSLLKEAPQQTTTPTSLSDLIQPCSIGEEKLITSTSELESNIEDVKDLKIATDTEQTKESDVKVEKHAKELSTASEILTVSPVPIQVAESVLQMEPKESMSDSQLVSQEVLSSTITPVHLTEDKMSINGSTALIDSTQDKEKSSSNITATVRDTETASKSSDSLKKSIETSQILLPVEQIESQHVETPVLSPENLETLEELIQKETTTQQSEKSESPIKETVESTESASSDKTPVRPSRAKEVTSPSTSVPKAAEQDSKSQEKGVKKAGKKSVEKPVTEGEPAETTEAESIEKKAGKKVVKKVVKKTKTKSEEGLDDSMEDGSSASKQKKTAKAVKKGTKSSQAPGTDTNVPESPSSSTSDAPVPPKRKTKATAVKSVTKKSDIEE